MTILRPMNADDLARFRKWLYTPHVAKWYHDPDDWIAETENKNNEFDWIHHYIVEYDGVNIGFCQYYAWGGYTEMGGTYSIDYLIGEKDFIGKGIGRHIVWQLIRKIEEHPDARRIVVQPEQGNKASCGLLLSCGFVYNEQKDIYLYEL